MSKTCLINAHIFTGMIEIESGAILLNGEKIEDIVFMDRINKLKTNKHTKFIDLKNSYLTPGFIDTHIHGINGFGTENGDSEDILNMSKTLPKFGVTRFCPTMYPASDEDFERNIVAIVDVMGKEKGALIDGIHLEGPFISKDKLGVQKPEFVKDVSVKQMRHYLKLAKNNISIMTVAPELKDMRKLAFYCLNKGIVLSAGHTDAKYNNMLEGIQSGILHSTHFGNAMRQLNHRDPGTVGAILIHPDISCEIIADGYHLHPATIKLIIKDKPINQIILVTDALRPTFQKTGTLLANNEEVYLDDKNVFRRKSDDIIAGSSLTLIQAIKNLFNWDFPLNDIIKMATINPAKLLKIERERGALIPGNFADITVFNKDFEIEYTFIAGKIIYENIQTVK